MLNSPGKTVQHAASLAANLVQQHHAHAGANSGNMSHHSSNLSLSNNNPIISNIHNAPPPPGHQQQNNTIFNQNNQALDPAVGSLAALLQQTTSPGLPTAFSSGAQSPNNSVHSSNNMYGYGPGALGGPLGNGLHQN